MRVMAGGGLVGVVLLAVLVGHGCGGGSGSAADAAVDRNPAEGGGMADGPSRPDAAADLLDADGPVDRSAEAPPGPDAIGADRRPDGPTPLAASFLLTPESFDFGTVPPGMSGTKMFELRNTGELNSGTPSITLMDGGGDIFRVVANGCETALEGGTSCAITVNFSPTVAGPQATLLEAEASPGGRVSTQLSGTGGGP